MSDTTTLTIRKVSPALKASLRMRAAGNARSMEAELRQILQDALAPESSDEYGLGTAIHRRFAALGGVELEIPPGEMVDFNAPSIFEE